MTTYGQQQLGPVSRLINKLETMFFSDRVIGPDGVGYSFTEVLAGIRDELCGIRHEMRRANDRRDREDGA
jgi:hypothetical protein